MVRKIIKTVKIFKSFGGYNSKKLEIVGRFPKKKKKKSPTISVRHLKLHSEMLYLWDVKLLMPTGFKLDSEYYEDILFIYHL